MLGAIKTRFIPQILIPQIKCLQHGVNHFKRRWSGIVRCSWHSALANGGCGQLRKMEELTPASVRTGGHYVQGARSSKRPRWREREEFLSASFHSHCLLGIPLVMPISPGKPKFFSFYFCIFNFETSILSFASSPVAEGLVAEMSLR